ncbi:MAG: fused MFS/spermidine synthase [Gammaproteobacteria bacterium]
MQTSDRLQPRELSSNDDTHNHNGGYGRDRRVLLLCAVASGAAALIYQVIWNRLLLVVFGSTTAATATVVAAFMGGMALGAWLLARYGNLVRRPARLYAILELSIAAYALLVPAILLSIGGLNSLVWETYYGQPLVLGAYRLVFGVLVLALPTVVMGATLPLLLRALEGRGPSSGLVSYVYGLNALGGAAGAAASGFWLLPTLGNNRATLIGVGLNIAVSLGVYTTFRNRAAGGVHADQKSRALVTPDKQQRRLSINRLALVIAGFAAIAYEIVWTRLLVLVNGSSTYTFSLVLTIYIAGLALGSLWIGKRVDHLRSAEMTFAHLQAAVALSAVVGIWLVTKMPYAALDVYAAAGISYSTSLAISTGTTVLALLPSSFLLGAAFPVSVKMIDPGGTRLFRPFGHAYAWTALGNVTGAIAAGAGLISIMGLQGSMRLLAATSLVAALICLSTARIPSIQRSLSVLVAGSLLISLVLMGGNWDTLALTSGVFKQAPVYLGVGGGGAKLDQILSNYTTVYYREGNQSVVSVVDRPTLGATPHRLLSVDGKVDASTGADMSTQLLSGQLPVILHKAPSNILIIGLASGVTVGAVASYPQVESITVAEIEPAVVDAAKEFSAFNNRALDDTRVNLVLDDGRHFLRSTQSKFDIIISEPSNPWMSGPARLFTSEFFSEASARLEAGGLFAQWVPLYGLSTSLLKAELRTLVDIFPVVALFQVSQGDLLIVGSQQPLSSFKLDAALTGGLASTGTERENFGARLITGDQGLRAWLGQGPRNTDNNGLLEFGAPRYLLSDVLSINERVVWEAPWQADFDSWFGNTMPGGMAAKHGWSKMANAFLSDKRFDRAEFMAKRIEDGAASKELLADIAFQREDGSRARALWLEADTPTALLKLTQFDFDRGKIETAARFLDQIPILDRRDRFYYLMALVYARLGDSERALGNLAKVTDSADNGRMVLAPALREIFRWRLDPQLERNWGRFEILLNNLRRELEYERGQNIFDELLAEIENLGRSLLTRAEYRRLRQIIQTRIITPMPIYYRGVSLLWLEEHAQADSFFTRYLASLPEEDKESRAHALLALSARHRKLNK